MIAPFRPSALLPPSDEDAPGWAAAWATLTEETVHLVTLHHRYACHTATSHLPRHTPRMPPRHATRTYRVTPHVTLMAASVALTSSCVPLWRFSDHATPCVCCSSAERAAPEPPTLLPFMLLYSAMAALAKVVEFSEHMVRKTPLLGHFVLQIEDYRNDHQDRLGTDIGKPQGVFSAGRTRPGPRACPALATHERGGTCSGQH